MSFDKHTSIFAETREPGPKTATGGAHLQPLGYTGVPSLGKLSPVLNCTEVDLKVTVRDCRRSAPPEGERSMQFQDLVRSSRSREPPSGVGLLPFHPGRNEYLRSRPPDPVSGLCHPRGEQGQPVYAGTASTYPEGSPGQLLSTGLAWLRPPRERRGRSPPRAPHASCGVLLRVAGWLGVCGGPGSSGRVRHLLPGHNCAPPRPAPPAPPALLGTRLPSATCAFQTRLSAPAKSAGFPSHPFPTPTRDRLGNAAVPGAPGEGNSPNRRHHRFI